MLNRSGLSGIGGEFFVEDVFAKDNTVIADVNAGTGDQFFYFGVGFAAKAAEGDVGRSSHVRLVFYSIVYFGTELVASARLGISFRDCTTSSTRP